MSSSIAGIAKNAFSTVAKLTPSSGEGMLLPCDLGLTLKSRLHSVINEVKAAYSLLAYTQDSGINAIWIKRNRSWERSQNNNTTRTFGRQ